MATWLEMPEFVGLDFSESYVLGWSVVGSELRFELDVVLVPGHPEYSPPPPEEWACYRRGALLFPDIVEIRGLPPIADVRPALGSDGSLDYGQIDALEALDSAYRVEGDFGDVFIASGRPRIVLTV